MNRMNVLKSKRNPNFSLREIEILVQEIETHRNILFTKQNNNITNAKKKRCWETICATVNAVNSSDKPRYPDDLRRKWTTLCSGVKAKIAQLRKEARKTGGGLPSVIRLTYIEERIAAIMGPTATTGVDGGIDTMEGTCSSIETKCVTETLIQQRGPCSTFTRPPQMDYVGTCSRPPPQTFSQGSVYLLPNKTPNRNVHLDIPSTSQSQVKMDMFNDDFDESPYDVTDFEPESDVRDTIAEEDTYDNTSTQNKTLRRSSSIEQLLTTENHRLEVEQKRLEIEQKRLAVEEERLAVAKETLQLKSDKYNVYISSLAGITPTIELLETNE